MHNLQIQIRQILLPRMHPAAIRSEYTWSLFSAYNKLGKYPGYLLEGMACPGGCVAGAGTMQAIKKSQTSVGLYAKQSTHKTSSETEYIKELNKLVD